MQKLDTADIEEQLEDVAAIMKVSSELMTQSQTKLRRFLDNDVIEKCDRIKVQDDYQKHNLESTLSDMSETLTEMTHNGALIIHFGSPEKANIKTVEHMYQLTNKIQKQIEIVNTQNKDAHDMLNLVPDPNSMFETPYFNIVGQCQISVGAAAYTIEDLCEKVKIQEWGKTLTSFTVEAMRNGPYNKIDLSKNGLDL